MATPQKLSAQEQALSDAFQRFDVNGDGKIQHEEFHRFMNNIGGFSSDEISALFVAADINSSGCLDLEEFIRWVCSGTATKSMSSSMAQSFCRMLQHEAATEASLIEEMLLSHAVQANLRESCLGKSAAKEQQERTDKTFRHKNSIDLLNSGYFAAPDEDYEGYRLPIPVTFDGATGLMRHYLLHGETEPLHPTYVSYLTLEFTKAYRAQHPKPVAQVDIPDPGRLIVVGDTHGQLADVLHILFQFGPPTTENRYLFNGDIADRGEHAVEIFMILFAFFLADPSCIIINRGNHENEELNAMDSESGGGFSSEVIDKYNVIAFRRFLGAFKVLSLSTVIQEEIFVVHGGLSRIKTLTVDFINSLPHHDYAAPSPASKQLKDQVFLDLLWSDPTPGKGKFKSDRGLGIRFGPDCTEKFCMENKFRFMIRSHQLPSDSEGYAKDHDGKCVTIFSASNYCGFSGNYGAVLVLTSDLFPQYDIFEHYASSLEELACSIEAGSHISTPPDSVPPMPGMPSMARVRSEDFVPSMPTMPTITRVRSDEEAQAASAARWDSELSRMIVATIEKKPQIWAHLMNSSTYGRTSVGVFQTIMSKFIEEPYPWVDAAHHWGILSEDETVDIAKFLGHWSVSMEFANGAVILGAIREIYASIISRDMDLEQALRVFDADGNGEVELMELRQAVGTFHFGLTGTQLDRLAGAIFSTMGQSSGVQSGTAGRIGVQEFLARFTLFFKQVDAEGSPCDLWISDAFEQIGLLILRTPVSVLLADFDKAPTTTQNISCGAAARKEGSSDKRATSPSGLSRGAAIKMEAKRRKAARAMTEKSPQQQRPPGVLSNMLALYQAMDVSGDGILSIQELASGLEKIPGISELVIQGEPLTPELLLKLVDAVDATRDGRISYHEFLKAFQISEEGAQDIQDSLTEDFATWLFRHRMSIRKGCLYLDAVGQGCVSANGFKKVLESVNKVLSKHEHVLTCTHLDLLVESLSEFGQDPLVNYEALLKAFFIVDNTKNRAVVKKF